MWGPGGRDGCCAAQVEPGEDHTAQTGGPPRWGVTTLLLAPSQHIPQPSEAQWGQPEMGAWTQGPCGDHVRWVEWGRVLEVLTHAQESSVSAWPAPRHAQLAPRQLKNVHETVLTADFTVRWPCLVPCAAVTVSLTLVLTQKSKRMHQKGAKPPRRELLIVCVSGWVFWGALCSPPAGAHWRIP